MLIDEETKKNMDYFSFVQYTFYKQWFKLKEYANSNGIKIIGDIPIFVATDSADTWSNSEIFQFDKYKRPTELLDAHQIISAKIWTIMGKCTL